MNYIDQINGFWEKCETAKISGIEISVYMALLNYCNRLNWKNPFICHWDILCQNAKISKNTYYKSIQVLEKEGFISYEKGQKNTAIKPTIFILEFKNNKGTIKEQKRNNKGIEAEQKGNLDKQLNLQTNKLINNRFIEFWNLYDKKVSKDKCEKIWAKLPEKDIEKIFETLPAFIASIKDKQFQPHPATYLNQKRWNDEIAGPAPVKSEIDKMHNRDLYYNHNEYVNICRAKKIEPIITLEEFYAK